MVEMYTIAWRSKITGETGGGTARYTRRMALKFVADMNMYYPELEHWMVKQNEQTTDN